MTDSAAPVASTPASRVGAIRRLALDATRLDRTQSDPIVSFRNAVGLVIPLTIAVASGHTSLGLPAAIGALQTAFADRPGPYRLRMMRMLVTALAAGVVTALAMGFSHDIVVSAALLAVCGFAAGELLSLGPSAAQVGVATTACAIVLGRIPQSPRTAVGFGLLVIAGGLVQTVLAVAAWPIGRHRPERQALATVYRQLAALARHPVSVTASPPLGTALADARATLEGRGHDHGPSVEAYRVLLDEAERSRQNILALSAYAERLGEQTTLPVALRLAGEFLKRIADMLHAGRELSAADERVASASVIAILAAGDALGESMTERAARNRLANLAGQLRAVLETARTGSVEGRLPEEVRQPSLRLRNPIEVIRANLDLRSSALRHATRLAILIPASDIVTRLAGVPRGYWVSLTILVVLRPDFASTFQRAFTRVLGTLIGLVLVTVLIHYVFGDNRGALIALVGVAFFGMRLAGPKNVALSAICLSAIVVVLLALAGQPAHAAAVDRLVATVAGGVVALLAALLWPSWERTQVRGQLAALLAAYGDHLRMVVAPDTTREQRVTVRINTRLARSNAEASVDRARSEPVDSRGAVELGAALLAHSHRLAHALAAIDATRHARDVYAQVPPFRELIDECLRALDVLQTAVAGAASPRRFPALRPLHDQFGAAVRASPGLIQDADVLIEATDRLVNSLDTMADVLRERRVLATGPSPLN